MRIEYHAEGGFVLPYQHIYTDWIIKVLNAKGLSPGELSFIFCSDEYLLSLNKKYLDHDYYTDILTFENDSEPALSGDIFVSIDRVQDNARKYRVSFQEELARVMIHGVLHLIGFNDLTESDKREMRRQEQASLEMFHVKQ